jgi:hypothetical protein
MSGLGRRPSSQSSSIDEQGIKASQSLDADAERRKDLEESKELENYFKDRREAKQRKPGEAEKPNQSAWATEDYVEIQDNLPQDRFEVGEAVEKELSSTQAVLKRIKARKQEGRELDSDQKTREILLELEGELKTYQRKLRNFNDDQAATSYKDIDALIRAKNDEMYNLAMDSFNPEEFQPFLDSAGMIEDELRRRDSRDATRVEEAEKRSAENTQSTPWQTEDY